MRTLNSFFGICGIVGGLGILVCLPLMAKLGVGGLPLVGFGFAAAASFRIGVAALFTGLKGTDSEQFGPTTDAVNRAAYYCRKAKCPTMAGYRADVDYTRPIGG